MEPSPITEFVKKIITSIYAARTEQEFDDAFKYFPASGAPIELNGKKISHSEYKAFILKQRKLHDTVGKVDFKEVVELQSGKETKETHDGMVETTTKGSVGVFFDVLLPMGRPGLSPHKVTSSLNVEVAIKYGAAKPPLIGAWLVTEATKIDQVLRETWGVLDDGEEAAQ